MSTELTPENVKKELAFVEQVFYKIRDILEDKYELNPISSFREWYDVEYKNSLPILIKAIRESPLIDINDREVTKLCNESKRTIIMYNELLLKIVDLIEYKYYNTVMVDGS